MSDEENFEVSFEALDFEKMSKEELIGSIKLLLDWNQNNDRNFYKLNEICELYKKMFKEEQELYNQAKPHYFASLRGLKLPFGFRLIRVKDKKDEND